MSDNKDLHVRFHLPGLRFNFPLNMYWVSLLKTHPEYFREGVEIGSFFGCFPVALWNGGRLISHDQCDANYINMVIQSANREGIPIRYTFTNPLITEHDLDDPFCNFCMKAGDNGMNEVMIFSPILEEYIRAKYPSYKINSSTCKEIKNAQDLNEEIRKDYQYVVLDFNLNNNWEFINQLEQKEKLEVLVNCLCQPGCKKRGEHYRWMAKQQKNLLKNRSLSTENKIPIEEWYCQYGEFNCIHTIKDYPTFISPERIWNEYVPRGINNFKIEGRTANLFSLIDTYSTLMLKPECMGIARLKLIANLQKAKIINVAQPHPAKFIDPETGYTC